MPNGPNQSYLYAERIRARLPRVLQSLREAASLTKYALAQKCGISRDMLGRIEAGQSIPGACIIAQIAHGLGLTYSEFTRHLEDGPGASEMSD